MKLHRIAVWIATIGLAATAHAEAPIIPPDAVVETVSTGDFRFTEGPSLAPDGSIYFTNIPNNAIHRYDPATGETTLFTDDSGGANGLAFSTTGAGSLLACAGKAREIRLYSPRWHNPENRFPHELMDAKHRGAARWVGLKTPHYPTPFVSKFAGVRLNSPNDLVITNDVMYFTDPRYGDRSDLEMKIEGVYATTNNSDTNKELSTVTRVIDNLVRPNGIGISPDEKTLYVNDNGDKKIWAYPILDPDRLGEARLVNDLADLGGPDGMTVDHAGRIYTTIYGKGVLILSPDGERLGFLETGPKTTNCTFGADGKTLYITAEQSLKRVVLNNGAD